MFKKILLITISFALLGAAQTPVRYSLQDILKMSLERNTMIKQSENNLSLADYGVRNAVGALLPTLSANGTWNWSRAEEKGGTTYFMGSVFPVPPSTTDSRNYNLSLNSNITLFDGLANIANLSKAKNTEKSAINQLDRLKQDIIFQTENKYFTVLKSKKLMLVQEQNLTWNKKSLETITEKNRLGQLPKTDVFQQQVDYGNAELQLLQSKNNYENSRNDLASFLQLDIMKDYEFVEDNSLINDTIGYEKIEEDYNDFSKVIEFALSKRSDYLSSKYDLMTRENDITIARSGHLPHLSGSLNAYTRANELNSLFDSKTFSVGLSLNIPIFDGFSTTTRVQLAEVNYDNTKIQMEEKEKQIKIELKKALLDFQTSKKKLDVNNKNLIAAELNKISNEEKYNLGSGTLLNLLISNSQYVNAQNQQISAIYDYLIQKKQLEYLVGTLSVNR